MSKQNENTKESTESSLNGLLSDDGWQKHSMNDYVLVKLSKTGIATLGKRTKPQRISCYVKGWHRFHVWELMQIFGVDMFPGNPNSPFEDMDIFIKPQEI